MDPGAEDVHALHSVLAATGATRTKTDAMLVFPLASARCYTKPLKLAGRALLWQKRLENGRSLALKMFERALKPIDRLHRAQDGGALLTRLRSQPSSRMGGLCLLYEQMITDPPVAVPRPPPQHRPADVYLSKFSALAAAGVWMPFIGCRHITGNEQVDTLATTAHHRGVPLTRAVAASDSSRQRLKELFTTLHPAARVANGKSPKPLPEDGIARRERATLLRLRTCPCERCDDPETLEHLLCACPALALERSMLTTAYRQQGIPATTTDDLLFPSPPNPRALHSLLEFVEATGITAYR
ncbi:hypothetical protein HPB52_011928 [Rhipicephalus sanguineus]|uniref:Tick transposon n=1 Tax=Rhipicephalus sanguineus TaxID=34632 RepID=A0A9D4PZN7_RHISA|nr:hypothetical protein HPB52_011928 [Rhipicephalus sanguineus]